MKQENEQSRRNTREEILNACIDLFSEQGFSAVSVRDITRRVGVNESTLYNHYTNKDEILDVIIEIFRREFGRAFTTDESEMERLIAGATPRAFLHHHMLGLKERLNDRVIKIWRIIYLELFRNASVRAFYCGEALKASARYYEKAFGLMMDRGMIQRGNAKVLADEFNYTVVGLQLENLLAETDGQDAAENAAKFMAHIEFFCRAIE